MAERISSTLVETEDSQVQKATLGNAAAKITILEALAKPSAAVSPNMSKRSTQQGTVDMEDD